MSYASTVLADSPAVYLRFGESSGAACADSSGNARDGSIFGTATRNAASLLVGDANPAITFSSGSPGRATVPNGSWMNGPTNWSVEFILKPFSAGGQQTLATIDNNGALGDIKWRVRVNGSTIEAITINASNTFIVLATPGSTVVAGTKIHCVWTAGPTAERIYINGTQVATVARASVFGTSAQGLHSGCLPGGSEALNGDLDELSVYTTELSAAQVTAHYNASTAASGTYSAEVLADNPWGYWLCNEGGGTTLADSAAGHANPMTVTGTPTFAVTGPKGVPAMSWPQDTNSYAGTAGPPGTTTDFTLEAWVYLTAFPSATLTMVSSAGFPNGFDSSSESGLGVDTAGKPWLRFWNGGDTTITGASALSLNAWHHVVGVGKAGSNPGFWVRVDKVDVATTSSGPAPAQNRPIWIHTGKISAGGAGRIGNVAYYKSALSNARSDAHFNAPDDNPPPATQEVSRVHGEVLTTLVTPTGRVSRVDAEVLSTLSTPEMRISRAHAEVLWQPSQPGEWVIE